MQKLRNLLTEHEGRKRFAYVLGPDQNQAPDSIQRYWESARDGGFAAFQAMKPGVRGEDVDAAQRALMQKNKSEYVMWSTGHPVGYVAHDAGPNLGGSHTPGQRPAAQLRPHGWPYVAIRIRNSVEPAPYRL